MMTSTVTTHSKGLPLPVVECVSCMKCKKTHPIDSEEYCVVYGNITIGRSGGIIGNNLDQDYKVKSGSVFCRGKCFSSAIKSATCSVEEYRQTSRDIDLLERHSDQYDNSLIK